MIRKAFIICSVFIILSNIAIGQKQSVALQDDSLRIKSENPDLYLAEDIAMQYYYWAGRQASKGIESSFVAFDSMLNYGNIHGMDEVLSEGYYGLGSLYYMQKKYLLAKTLTLKSLAIHSSNRLSKMGKYTQLADVCGALGIMDTAYMCFDTLFANKDLLKERQLIGNAYMNFGKLLTRDNRYISAIESFEKSLEVKKDFKSPLQSINVYTYIAEVYLQINENEKALEYLKRSVQAARDNKYKITLGKSLAKLGNIYKVIGNYPQAINFFNEALTLLKGKGYTNMIFLINVNLADVYIELNKIPKAKEYVIKSQALFNDDLGYQAVAKYYLMMGRFKLITRDKSGLADSKEALVLAKANNSKNYTIGSYKNLRNHYKSRGEYETALLYSDSIKLVEIAAQKDANNNYIYDYETRYQKSLQDTELRELRDKEAITQLNLAKRNNQLLISSLGFLLALVLGGAIYYFYRLKAKNNIKLEDKNVRLTKALATNKMLIKEIHHRVKNNLQVVSSLLNLQSNYEKDEQILQAINTGRNRVQSMSILHQNLYGNENLREINISKYFSELVNSLLLEYPLKEGKKIISNVDVSDVSLDIDTVVPLGLIVNELITNSLKYAYKDQEEYTLDVSMKKAANQLMVLVVDNGDGLPFDELPEQSSSMGTQLIRSFVNKLEAEIKIDNNDGAKVTIIIPLAPTD